VASPVRELYRRTTPESYTPPPTFVVFCYGRGKGLSIEWRADQWEDSSRLPSRIQKIVGVMRDCAYAGV
jgi:hypothetical protein